MPQRERPSQAESRRAGGLLGSGRSGARERRSPSGARRAGRRNPLQLKTDTQTAAMEGALADGLHPWVKRGQAMGNLVIWNVVVAAVLGGIYGTVAHLLVGRGGAGRTALKTIGIILLTGAPFTS